jgi:hypothetical protein
LPAFQRLWRFYYYVYLGFRVFELARRHAGAPNYSIYDSPAYSVLARRLLHYTSDHQRDDPGSTFVLARKVAAVAT